MGDNGAERPRLVQATGLAVALLVTFVAAGVGSVATATSVDTWYAALDKPDWTPPSWSFGPVWTTLYLLMAVAAWRIWNRHERSAYRGPLFVYGIQLSLNALWSLLFFGLRRPGLALVEIVVLLATIVWTFVEFRTRDRLAAYLLVPYLAWVVLAAALNAALWWLNR